MRLFATLAMMLVMLCTVVGVAYGQHPSRVEGDRLFDEGKYEEARAQYYAWKAGDRNADANYAERRIAQCDQLAEMMTIIKYNYESGNHGDAATYCRESLKNNPKDPIELPPESWTG